MKQIKLLDAFAGIGGFHLGVNQACDELGIDFECVGAIEFDKNARKTYKDNFPDVKMFDDITKIPINDIPDHNILTGGFPCQPFSINNMTRRRNNKDVLNPNITIDKTDERNNLFLYLVNILKHKSPEYFIFENVSQLTKMRNEDGSLYLNTILNTLKQETDNKYNIQYEILNAYDYGVPQQRKRIFIVGSLKQFDFPKKIKHKSTVKDILEDKVNDKYLLINAWKNKKNKEGKPRLDVLKDIYSNKKVKYNKVSPVAILTGDTPSGVSRQHDRIYSINGISRTVATFGHPGFDVGLDDYTKWRLLTPREHARLQGFNDSFIINQSDNTLYKQFGNAVCVDVVEKLVTEILKNV